MNEMRRAVRTRVRGGGDCSPSSAFACEPSRAGASRLARSSPPNRATPSARRASLVLLDIVVRDKKGRPVRDLDPKDVQVSEDGARRDLTAFRLVEGRASAERVGASEAAGLQPDPSRQVCLVTFVFDKLIDGRQLAAQAALDFLANHTADNVCMSVWTIDQRLELRQDFTHDAYALKQAIYKAVNTTSVKAASLAGESAQQQQFATDAGNTAANLQSAAVQTGPGGPGGPGASTIGAANADAQMAEVIAGILRFTAQHPARSSRGSRRSIRCSGWSRRRVAGGAQDAHLLLGRPRRPEEPRGGVPDRRSAKPTATTSRSIPSTRAA